MASVLTVTIAGQLFNNVIAAEVNRDLRNLAGTFEIKLVDEARIRAALIAQIGQPSINPPIKRGDPITLAIDGEPILVGWINLPRFRWNADEIECTITGRDKTGDLVDCAALPTGPTEFRGVDLLHVANVVCAPFGIPVRADVDIGAPFDRLAVHKHMTGLAFLESATRQRSVLLTSDGIGGLVLTRGGTTRGPAALAIGENVHEVDAEFDEETRFSDYFVTQDTVANRSGAPAFTHTSAPSVTELAGGVPLVRTATEAATIGQIGHATDPEVTRWRPTLQYTRSQSAMATVQEQAEWRSRVAKGQSDRVRMTVLEWRAGAGNILWRPNQIVPVWDPYSGIDRDMLISAVRFRYENQTRKTTLCVVGPSAYDRINEADRRRRGRTVNNSPGRVVVQPLSAS
jgi:prophage tail gpP-like protein